MKIKTLILTLILLMCSFLACVNDNYTYKWKVEVTYMNSEKDTINCQYDSFDDNGNKNNCYLYLSNSTENGLFASAVEPCLRMGSGFCTEIVANGVRKFKILSVKKIQIKK